MYIYRENIVIIEANLGSLLAQVADPSVNEISAADIVFFPPQLSSREGLVPVLLCFSLVKKKKKRKGDPS